MKKIITFAGLLFTTAIIHAQDEYTTAMLDNMHALDTATAVVQLNQLAATFSAIYEVKRNWCPLYYECLACIKLSEAYTATEQKKSAIERAATLLDSLPVDNDEVLVLRAMFAMDYLAIDRSAWQTYLPMINSSLAKAQALNPGNPRSYYLQAVLKFNMPESMGGGHSAGIKLFQTAQQKFSVFTSNNAFAPTWGRKDVEKYLSMQ